MRVTGRRGSAAARGIAALAAAAWLAASGCSSDGHGDALPAQSWSLASDTLTTPGLHSQGIASLPERGADVFAFTSRFSLDRARGETIEKLAGAIPGALAPQKFDHLGDIDAFDGLIYGGLEDNSEPYGDRYHRAMVAYDAESLAPTSYAVDPGAPDVAGDGDNAWVAVSPDGAWVVSSEWDPQDSLIVFGREAVLAGGEIAEVARIPLDAPLARIQGCDFDGPRTLLCASDDGATGKLVWSIVLSSPLAGGTDPADLTGHVAPLFPTLIPKNVCGVEAEVEGIDVSGDELRVMVIGTCLVDTHVDVYVRD